MNFIQRMISRFARINPQVSDTRRLEAELAQSRAEVAGYKRSLDVIMDQRNHLQVLLDNAPDPDQHPSDLQDEYRGWLATL